MRYKLLVLILIKLINIKIVFSQNNGPTENVNHYSNSKSYTTKRLTTDKPVIDGRLDDNCWQTGDWSGDFVQWKPKEGANPSYPTYLKVLYDDNNIYVAIRAFDGEPDKISRKAGRRDEMTGDMVGICFDSYHDHRTGFEFALSANGQKIDYILTNPVNSDYEWNAVWTGKTGLEDSAWVAEYEIPLSQLRYSSEIVQTWGLHCWRWIDRLQEESDWEPQTSTGPGILYLFGHLNGIQNLPKSQRIEIMPYVVSKINTFEKQSGNPYAKDEYRWQGTVGLDAKIGLSSNFTADIAINPDFGQVEADPSVINLTAYETFYEEKRPFFLEGKNIFNFEFDGINLFYSRRVGQNPSYQPLMENGEYLRYPDKTSILSALKISGKSAKGLSVGILHSVTNNERAKISNGITERKETVKPLVNYLVGRIQKDFNEGTTILGGIFTSSNKLSEDEKFNYLPGNAFSGGVDFMHQWLDKEFYLKAKVIGSTVFGDTEAIKILQTSPARYYQRPDARHLKFNEMMTRISGHGGNIQIGKGSKGHWRYWSSLSWQTPGLELKDLGFMQLADHVKNTNYASYFITQPKGIFRSFSTSFNQVNHFDYDLNYLSSQFTAMFDMQFRNKWSVFTHVCHFPKSLDTRILQGGNAMKMPAVTHSDFKISSDFSKRVAFSFYTLYEKRSEKSLSYFNMNSSITYRPVNTLKISASINYTLNSNELQYIDNNDNKNIEQDFACFLGRINQKTLDATFRIDFNISPEISLQYYGSPYFSVGSYSNFKLVDNPQARDYRNRYRNLNPVLLSDNVYKTSEGYSFNNPDFCFSQFRSNMVFRWEYRPGSQLFFVWSNERTGFENSSGKSLHDSYSGLQKAFPKNLFLIKLSYWFSI